VLVFNLGLKAQLPDGSIGPDWTATDIDGVEHHLYDYLDNDKVVIIDFFTTWCSPCWDYHNNGALDEMWELYGPEGTDEVMIFQIETDIATDMEDLLGNTSGSQGNWIEGVEFPTIDDAPNPNNPPYGTICGDLYEVSYIPTIYVICPSRNTNEDHWEDGYMNAEELYEYMGGCEAATEQIDVAIKSYEGSDSYCNGQLNNAAVVIQNLSLEGNLTQATLNAMLDGIAISTVEYSGDLPLYSIETVPFESITGLPEVANLTFQVVLDGDTYLDNNEIDVAVTQTTLEAELNFTIEVQPDDYPDEISFELLDENGNLLYEVAAGSIETSDLHTFDISISEPACITWNIHDVYGDGICCDYGDGYIRLLDTESGEELLLVNGEYGSGTTKSFAALDPTIGIDERYGEKLQIYPNPARDYVTIVAESTIQKIEIFDHTGKSINTYQPGLRYLNINTTGIQSGVYFIKIFSHDNVITRKLVIE